MKAKKFFIGCLCLAMMFCMAIPVFAAEQDLVLDDNHCLINGKIVAQEDAASYNDGTLKFHSAGSERISSDGSFSFGVQYRLESDKFKVNSTESTIDVRAFIIRETPNGNVNVTDQYVDHHYTVEMVETGLLGRSVGKGTFYANGSSYQFTAVDLSPKKTYKLIITNNDDIGVVDFVNGNGTISNFKEVVK